MTIKSYTHNGKYFYNFDIDDPDMLKDLESQLGCSISEAVELTVETPDEKIRRLESKLSMLTASV